MSNRRNFLKTTLVVASGMVIARTAPASFCNKHDFWVTEFDA